MTQIIYPLEVASAYVDPLPRRVELGSTSCFCCLRIMQGAAAMAAAVAAYLLLPWLAPQH